MIKYHCNCITSNNVERMDVFMKNLKKFVALVAMLTFVSSINVFAAESIPCRHTNDDTTICSYDPNYVNGSVTSYRCPKSNCRAYLIYKYPIGNCVYCNSKTHAYACSHCPEWYCICESGDFNPVYGR